MTDKQLKSEATFPKRIKDNIEYTLDMNPTFDPWGDFIEALAENREQLPTFTTIVTKDSQKFLLTWRGTHPHSNNFEVESL